MRELKKEISIEKRAGRYQNASALVSSNDAFDNYKSNMVTPRHSHGVGSAHPSQPSSLIKNNLNSREELRGFDNNRATSLPKISSRVKLSQF